MPQFVPEGAHFVKKHAGVEPVVPGENRCVRSEHALAAYSAYGFLPTFTQVQLFAEQFEGQEGAMPFVHMVYVRFHPEGAQQPDASDAEDDFLLEPCPTPPLVQSSGDIPKLLRIVLDVGVEQVQGCAANLGPPCLYAYRLVAEVDGDQTRIPILPANEFKRVVFRIDSGVPFLLPAVFGEVLLEVALFQKEADRREGNAEVRGRFRMVAGQYAQSARIDRQAFVDAELHAEVAGPGGMRDRARRCEVRGHRGMRRVDVACKVVLERCFRGKRLQYGDGVVSGVPERHSIQTFEEIKDFGIPTPPEIFCERSEFFVRIHKTRIGSMVRAAMCKHALNI